MTRALPQPRIVFPPADNRTADTPPEQRGLRRDQVRLLVATAATTTHARFTDLGEHLRPGDLLVVNNSRVVAAEIDAGRSGRDIVLHCATRLGVDRWVIELRTAPDAAAPILDGRAGEPITVPGWGRLVLESPYPAPGSSPTGTGTRLWSARAESARAELSGTGVPENTGVPTGAEGSSGPAADLRHHLDAWGRPISYGYLARRFPLSAYQTIFATVPGSAEMPSAARPFSPELVAALVARGIGFAPITLHTGVSSQDAGELPQPEWFRVAPETAWLVNAARRNGGRIVAVGTTATRALESATDASGRVRSAGGWTDRVVTPDDPPRVVDGLVTGWHNPDASHLLLVEAVAGAELAQRAYREAVAHGYLWHEFGDSGLLLPR